MPVCRACGFDNAEPEKACPLCGAEQPPRGGTFAEAPTVAGHTPGPPAPKGGCAPGDLYAGRYRIEALVGRGGMGTVYRVRDETSGSVVALKLLSSSLGNDADGAERFRREIRTLARLEHPAVPRVYDSGDCGGELWFTAEFIEGSDLKAGLAKSGPWPPAQAAALGATLADALAAAHAEGIVHRDVKPHNVMLRTDGAVRLLDFGVARSVGIDMTTLTRTGMVVGTPEYMSPEQFDGRRVDERSDIYSLGVLLFEVLTGRLPFRGDTPVAMALKHLAETPPAPRALRGDLPLWIERVVLRCLEKDPARRFGSAAELAVELRKERRGSVPVTVRLPNGDAILEDEGESSPWALSIAAREKPDWSVGMAMRYRETYYKLVEIVRPEGTGRITYHFEYWPQELVFRKVVDYEPDGESAAGQGMAERLRKWLPGRRQ